LFCGALLKTLQSDTSGFVQQAPVLGSQYRPLNLIVAGVQLMLSLKSQTQELWSAFRALKHAPNAQAAALALQRLSSSLSTTEQTVSRGFQNPGGWYASGGFVQQTGPSQQAPAKTPQ
jgi:hypothetical protein